MTVHSVFLPLVEDALFLPVCLFVIFVRYHLVIFIHTQAWVFHFVSLSYVLFFCVSIMLFLLQWLHNIAWNLYDFCFRIALAIWGFIFIFIYFIYSSPIHCIPTKEASWLLPVPPNLLSPPDCFVFENFYLLIDWLNLFFDHFMNVYNTFYLLSLHLTLSPSHPCQPLSFLEAPFPQLCIFFYFLSLSLILNRTTCAITDFEASIHTWQSHHQIH